MEKTNPIEIANKVWSLLETSRVLPIYMNMTDSEILSSLVINGIITIEDLNMAFDVRKKNKSR